MNSACLILLFLYEVLIITVRKRVLLEMTFWSSLAKLVFQLKFEEYIIYNSQWLSALISDLTGITSDSRMNAKPESISNPHEACFQDEVQIYLQIYMHTLP